MSTTTAVKVPGSLEEITPAWMSAALQETMPGVEVQRVEVIDVIHGACTKIRFGLAGDPRLLWNVAVCEKNLRRYSRMLRTIRRYQTEEKKVRHESKLRRDAG